MGSSTSTESTSTGSTGRRRAWVRAIAVASCSALLLTGGCAGTGPGGPDEARGETTEIYRAVLRELASEPAGPSTVVVLDTVCRDAGGASWGSDCTVPLAEVADPSALSGPLGDGTDVRVVSDVSEAVDEEGRLPGDVVLVQLGPVVRGESEVRQVGVTSATEVRDGHPSGCIQGRTLFLEERDGWLVTGGTGVAGCP